MPLPGHMQQPNQTPPLMTLNLQSNVKGAVSLSQISTMIQQQKTMPQPGERRKERKDEDGKKTKKQNNKETANRESKPKPNNGTKTYDKVKDSNKNLYMKYKTAMCRHYEQTGTC